MRLDANGVMRITLRGARSLSFCHGFQSMQPFHQRSPLFHILRETEDNEEETRRRHGMGQMNLRLYTPTIEHAKQQYDSHTKRELKSLNVAIAMNSLIFVAKACVAQITGSSSMLAEALHSIADILNQTLLRVGLIQSQMAPNAKYNYGYHRDRFIFSLISAVGIFFLGAGASVFHGFHSLGAGADHQLESVFWTYVVLGVSGMLEGYSLHVALEGVREGAKQAGQTMTRYIASGSDPTTVAVLMEDGGALAGLLIAAIATALTHYTGSALYDACGSIGIGCLLGGIAYWLVAKNRQLLIGRSMDQSEQDDIKNLLRRDSSVAYITDCKTEEIGPRVFRFKAEVAWDGERLAERYLARIGRDKFISRLQQALSEPSGSDNAQVDRILKAYGKGIISAVGAEVDRLENEIQALNPNVRFVDLETDRGRVPVRKTIPNAMTLSNSLDFMEEEEEEGSGKGRKEEKS